MKTGGAEDGMTIHILMVMATADGKIPLTFTWQRSEWMVLTIASDKSRLVARAEKRKNGKPETRMFGLKKINGRFEIVAEESRGEERKPDEKAVNRGPGGKKISPSAGVFKMQKTVQVQRFGR